MFKTDIYKCKSATSIVMQEQKYSILSQILRIRSPFMHPRKKFKVDVTSF